MTAQPRALHSVEVGEDHVTRRGDQQPAEHAAAVVGVCLSSGWKSSTACSTGMGRKSCTWKGSDVLSSSRGQPGQVDLADDDPGVGDTEHYLLAAEPGMGPQLLQGVGDGVGVDHLTVTHCALGQHDLAELLERHRACRTRALRRARPTSRCRARSRIVQPRSLPSHGGPAAWRAWLGPCQEGDRSSGGSLKRSVQPISCEVQVGKSPPQPGPPRGRPPA